MARRSSKKRAANAQAPVFASREILWAAVLIVAVVIVHLPAWAAGYIWDDDLMLTSNPVVVGPLGLREIWTTPAADICPLTLTTFRLEYALWGLAPLPYHLVNVALHAACAVLLWRVLLALRIPGAWLGAALWALHPVMTESAAWIAETKNTESCLFYLLAILFFVRSLREPRPGNRDHLLTLLFAALAMSAKTSTIVLPVVLGLCAWWIEGRLRWRTALRLSPTLLLSLAAAALSIWTQSARANQPQWSRPWPERLVAAGDAVWFYLGKLVWPQPLALVYPRWQIDATQALAYLPLAAAILLLALFWLKRATWGRPWFFAFGYFVAALAPELGLINNSFSRFSLVADHFQYLAAMGPLALTAAGGHAPGRQTSRQPRRVGARDRRRAAARARRTHAAARLGFSELGIALDRHGRQESRVLGRLVRAGNRRRGAKPARCRCESFPEVDRPQSALFQVPLQPRARPRQAGPARCRHRRVPNGARPRARRAASPARPGGNPAPEGATAMAPSPPSPRRPITPRAHYEMGLVDAQEGQLDTAAGQFNQALAIDPDYAEAHAKLALVYLQQQRLPDAIAQLREVVRLRPDSSEAQAELRQVEGMMQPR